MADIASFDLSPFVLERVLGYPHAGNDVFHVTGRVHGASVEAYLKVARQAGADIPKEAEVLTALASPLVPQVIAHQTADPKWLLTAALPGMRLSSIVGDNKNRQSLAYLPLQGAALARLHSWQVDVAPVQHRKVFDVPPPERLRALGLDKPLQFVKANLLPARTVCFVHGDFHYANLLWHEGQLSAILDFELCGLGNPSFDIAWAVFLRPEQRYLDTLEEVAAFLQGYESIMSYQPDAFWYWYIHIGLHFVLMADADDQLRMVRLIRQALRMV